MPKKSKTTTKTTQRRSLRIQRREKSARRQKSVRKQQQDTTSSVNKKRVKSRRKAVDSGASAIKAIKYVTGGGEPAAAEQEEEEEAEQEYTGEEEAAAPEEEEEEEEGDHRSRDYECYKMSDKDLCDSNTRCLWDNSWTNIFTRNKCKSKLFHSLKISYPAKPTDFKKIIESLAMLEAKSEKKKLTKSEEIDLRILQEFRDDYVLFDNEVKSSVMHKMNLQKLYDVEKDYKKKQLIKKELDELNKTTMGRIGDFLKTKEVLMFFMVSLAGLLTWYGIGAFGKVILDQYERYAMVNDTSHTTQSSNNLNMLREQVNQSRVNVQLSQAQTDQAYAQTGYVNAQTGLKNAETGYVNAQTAYSKMSGMENLVRSGANLVNAGTAWVNPIFYAGETAKEVLRDKDITGNISAGYGEAKGLLSGLGSGLGSVGSAVGSGIYSLGSGIAGLWSRTPSSSSSA